MKKGAELQSEPITSEEGTADPVADEQRPVYMQILGLLPPYSLEDIHKAYKAHAASAHPDRGGVPEDFIKIQQAYDQAQQHMQFRQGRRAWMANLVEPYVKQQEIVEQVRQRNGDVQIEKIDWMQHSYGDFAALTERLRSIALRDMAKADEFLKILVSYNESLRFLDELILSGSDLSDVGLSSIVKIQSMKRLNLSGTRITASGLAVVGQLPDLAWINLAGLFLNWWDRRSLRRRIPQVEVVFT